MFCGVMTSGGVMRLGYFSAASLTILAMGLPSRSRMAYWTIRRPMRMPGSEATASSRPSWIMGMASRTMALETTLTLLRCWRTACAAPMPRAMTGV